MIKGSIQQEDITLVNIYPTNTGAPQYVRQLLLDINGETNNNTVRVGDFNTPLTSINGENQDGGVGRHTAPPRTTTTDRKPNGKEVQHQGNKK